MDQMTPIKAPSATHLWLKVMIVVGVLVVAGGLLLLPRGNSCYLKSNRVPADAGLGIGAYLTARAECFQNIAVQQHDPAVCLKIYDRSLVTSCVYDTAAAAKDVTKCAALKSIELSGDQYQKTCEDNYRTYVK